MSGTTEEKTAQRLRWFVLRTRRGAEAKAAVHVARLGVTVFVPMFFERERQGKWLVPVERGPLFPRYIFVALRRDTAPWGTIRAAEGVEHILCTHAGTPVAVPYREMRRIRTRHSKGEKKKVVARFRKGQTVRVTAGPFEGHDALFDAPAKDRVNVLLSIFGRETKIELDEQDLRAA